MKVQKKRHITVTTLFHRVDSLIRYSTILLRYATYIFIFASFFYVVFVGFIHKKNQKSIWRILLMNIPPPKKINNEKFVARRRNSNSGQRREIYSTFGYFCAIFARSLARSLDLFSVSLSLLYERARFVACRLCLNVNIMIHESAKSDNGTHTQSSQE